MFEQECKACGQPAPGDDGDPRLCPECMGELLRHDSALLGELPPEVYARLAEVAGA